jgi:hypothetical protein
VKSERGRVKSGRNQAVNDTVDRSYLPYDTKIPSIREGGVQNFEPLHRYNGPNPPV